MNEKYNLTTWLTDEVKLPEYIPSFLAEGFEDMYEVIPEMTESDLATIGITKKGHVKKIMLHIEHLKAELKLRKDESAEKKMKTKKKIKKSSRTKKTDNQALSGNISKEDSQSDLQDNFSNDIPEHSTNVVKKEKRSHEKRSKNKSEIVNEEKKTTDDSVSSEMGKSASSHIKPVPPPKPKHLSDTANITSKANSNIFQQRQQAFQQQEQQQSQSNLSVSTAPTSNITSKTNSNIFQQRQQAFQQQEQQQSQSNLSVSTAPTSNITSKTNSNIFQQRQQAFQHQEKQQQQQQQQSSIPLQRRVQSMFINTEDLPGKKTLSSKESASFDSSISCEVFMDGKAATKSLTNDAEKVPMKRTLSSGLISKMQLLEAAASVEDRKRNNENLRNRNRKMKDYENLFASIRADKHKPGNIDSVKKPIQNTQDDPPKAPSNLKKLVAIGNFKGESSVELTFREGDIILVLEEHQSGWWKGELSKTGDIGLFPFNYCEIYREELQAKPKMETNPGKNEINLEVLNSSEEDLENSSEALLRISSENSPNESEYKNSKEKLDDNAEETLETTTVPKEALLQEHGQSSSTSLPLKELETPKNSDVKPPSSLENTSIPIAGARPLQNRQKVITLQLLSPNASEELKNRLEKINRLSASSSTSTSSNVINSTATVG